VQQTNQSVKSMEDAVELLRKLGLTEYEARAYSALLSLGPATASEISRASSVPYTKIYQMLSMLEERKWVEVQGRRPTRYLARPPSEALEILLAEEGKRMRKLAEEAAPLLESIRGRRSEMVRPDVWVIRGIPSVLRRAAEMIRRAESEILLSLPYLPEDAAGLISLLPVLAAKASVRVLTAKGVKLRVPGVKIRRRENLFGGGVIVDGREVLLILGRGDVIGIWSNDPGLARFAEEYFNYLWGGENVGPRR